MIILDWPDLTKQAVQFFYQPILYHTYIIVAVDFFFGVYRSWLSWRIESHLFDRTIDKLIKYTLTYILFHTLSVFPMPVVALPLTGFVIFDPSTIDEIVMFVFMCRETISILEHLLRHQRVASMWPGLDYVVGLLGKIFRLAEARPEVKLADPIQDRPQVDDHKPRGEQSGS